MFYNKGMHNNKWINSAVSPTQSQKPVYHLPTYHPPAYRIDFDPRKKKIKRNKETKSIRNSYVS